MYSSCPGFALFPNQGFRIKPSIRPHNAAHAPKGQGFLTDMGCTEAEGFGAAQLAGGGNWEHACMGEAGRTS
eukprot:1160511-Pelagomonas_calceolata.AAC.1